MASDRRPASTGRASRHLALCVVSIVVFATGCGRATPEQADAIPSASSRSTEHSLTVAVVPDHGDHSTLFAGSAFGFTPNGKVTVSATMPGGTAYPTTYPKTADGTGAFSWSWQWDAGEPDGVWTIKFRDHTSGKTTSTSLTITG